MNKLKNILLAMLFIATATLSTVSCMKNEEPSTQKTEAEIIEDYKEYIDNSDVITKANITKTYKNGTTTNESYYYKNGYGLYLYSPQKNADSNEMWLYKSGSDNYLIEETGANTYERVKYTEAPLDLLCYESLNLQLLMLDEYDEIFTKDITIEENKATFIYTSEDEKIKYTFVFEDDKCKSSVAEYESVTYSTTYTYDSANLPKIPTEYTDR